MVGPVAKVGVKGGCTSTAAASAGEGEAGGAPNPGVLAMLDPLCSAPELDLSQRVLVEAVGRFLIGTAS